MLKRSLVIATLILVQLGCSFKTEPYESIDPPQDARQRAELKKREFMKIEDMVVGGGPIAAWNRRIKVTLEVKYSDGTTIFQGPVFYYAGFTTMPDTSVYDERHLNGSQEGIRLGINGMAVGGHRRITLDAALVCSRNDINGCHLVGPGNTHRGTTVRKENLIVEAKLIEACIPLKLRVYIWPLINYYGEVTCRDQPIPKISPSDTIWHFY